MDRLEAFEKMLNDLQERANYEKKELDRLKSEGKEKTATYQLYMANRLLFNRFLEFYEKYGLI